MTTTALTPATFHQEAMAQAHRVLVEVDDTFRDLLAALLAGGHVLLEGVPGTAKTLMARVLARLVAGSEGAASFRRIQFTPDLMPSDIVGTHVFDARTATFTLRPGPIFAHVVVADEINRAPAKTQSALLEAMEEQQVTIEGERLALPPVFVVVATQNPVEFEGTYPLPEAQLDRFLFKLRAGHASEAAEREILARHEAGLNVAALPLDDIQPLATADQIVSLRQQVAAVRVDDSVAGYIVAVGRATRTTLEVQYGASVRGALAMLGAGKAVAAFAGRDYVTPDDVKAVAAAALRHRLVLKPEVELDGVTTDDVVQRILASVPVPR